MTEPMKILAYDIERIPAVSFHWTNFNVTIPIGMTVRPGEMVSFAARWYGQPKNSVVYRSVWEDGVQGMLDDMHDLMDEADALLGYNSAGFDLKHVNTEMVKVGMTPPSTSLDLDLYKTVKRRFKFQSNKLDYVSKELGVGQKMAHEGWGLWEKAMAGDESARKRFRKYNEQDVHLTIDLYDRLKPWIVNHPNANLYQDIDGCGRCGSLDLQSRGTRPSGLGVYRRYQCKDCGSWSTSGKSERRVDIRPEN